MPSNRVTGKTGLRFVLLAIFSVVGGACLASVAAAQKSQPIDEEYTKKIREYTTAPYFTSTLVDHLPASTKVPTPKVVLGDVAGAPGILPYSAQVYEYMRMLEKASPRVKVYSIGHTEEGREMIAVAVSSEANLAALDSNRASLAKLADPRTIHMDDVEADRLARTAVPVYYITGTIHSTETGAPTALMELAYRLAVDESPYVQDIRDHVVTLITPVVEVDGRDRMVDLYRWHLAHPKQNYPHLVYWGHYVAHDNNRDAMGVTLKLTENVLNTFVGWKAQVLHDLHESVPYLYDNTAGDGPFNAWVDPILTSEWEMLGWRNVADMTELGMPGVFTHGDFDTWSPGYLMFIAAMHNGISRLYETFGNGGADTEERTLDPSEYSRTWYRQDPPLPKALWSQRDNNNYEETGLLTSLHFFSDNRQLFLKNFYLKSKRSIAKPQAEGPAAYVLPGDEPHTGRQRELLRVLLKQGCEIQRSTASFEVTLPAAKSSKHKKHASGSGDESGAADADTATASDKSSDKESDKKPAPTEKRTFPAGSYVIRMDQPYSRIADALLDYQYWSPDDPQKNPYDDTGWTFGELFGVQVVRVTDTKVLDAAMEPIKDVPASGGVNGSGQVFAINNNGDAGLAVLRYRLKNADIVAAEEPFDAAGKKFSRGTLIVRSAGGDLSGEAGPLGLDVRGLEAMPVVKTHPVRAARVALLHTWLSTQDEGWWRLALDKTGIPYDYISTQVAARDEHLRVKYDVILFPPVGSGDPMAAVRGMPTDWGNPLPWLKTPETPNLGLLDSTEDIRPGLGWIGVSHLQDFVDQGGVLVTAMDTARLALQVGWVPGVSLGSGTDLRIIGSVVRAERVDEASPIAYGYDEKLSVYCFNGPIFNLSNLAGGRGGRRRAGASKERPTGRGTADDPDFTPGRTAAEAPEEPHAETWEALPLTEEQRRNGVSVIPPALRPRVIFRYADAKDLLVSGLAEGESEIAEHAAVIDVPRGSGHVVLFSNNPLYRGETLGSYGLVLNTILNFDNLNAGRKLDKE